MATTTPQPVPILNFTLKAGEDESFPSLWTDDNGAPMNLTGYLMEMTIRAFPESPIALLTLSSTNSTGSYIVLSGTTGTFELIFAGADTASLVATGLPLPGPRAGGLGIRKVGIYDLKFVPPGGKVGYLFEGTINLDPRSTV
jgi:hypothetical protein